MVYVIQESFWIPISPQPDVGDIQSLEPVLVVWRSSQVAQRLQEVQAGENTGVIDRIDRDLTRPTDDEGDAHPAFVHLVLPATKSFRPPHHVRAGRVADLVGFVCIERVSGGSLITGKDDDRVLRKSQLIQLLQQPADSCVQAPVVGEVVPHAGIDTQSPFISACIELVGFHLRTEE